MRIAVDAMGGDYAPEAIVEGTVQAAKEYGFSLILVGQEEHVQKELAKYNTSRLSIEVRHASQIVDMHDLPSVALRRKRDSSLHVAINMIKSGKADAAVSAGNTGAAMAIGKVACRMLEGIDRPALSMGFPNINGVTVVVDVGANVDCKPLHLLQFAVMAHVYAQEVFGIADPRIGLLSIGEEESKGNTLTKDVFEPLRQSPLNFIGNAEGRDLFNGRVDVLICDGFTGNVMLKVSESLAKTIGVFLKDAFTTNWRTKLGYLLVKPAINAMRKRIDHSEYGGAPLLGLNGVVIVGHGSSKAIDVKNAIRVAAESVQHHITDQITETLHRCEFDTKAYTRATSLWSQIKRSIRQEGPKEKSEKGELEEEKTTLSASDEQQRALDAHRETGPGEEYKSQEHEKQYWWSRKTSAVDDPVGAAQQQADNIDSEKEREQALEATLPENAGTEANDLEQTVKEPPEEKRHWWSRKSGHEPILAHSEEHAGEHLLNSEAQYPETGAAELEKIDTHQEKDVDEHDDANPESDDETNVAKKSWWKRQSHQQSKDDLVQHEEEPERPADKNVID
ncbi:hypothetical protein CSB45_10490 [candidate division KSB3 bacterium]|uniref:Phosphate acyltransferase n=1 Tax=candidate division KSB3 bacterium TaxID=2044937 RepID=A0A2G6E3Z5_9BACT|nr:MAG: hypothetical protein CSB45_10490 [candidate division KSB3 bacterium]PIE29159.1 MAG: hypothetical protein CSA57_10135 [candidate division KSB3 bacterium]